MSLLYYYTHLLELEGRDFIRVSFTLRFTQFFFAAHRLGAAHSSMGIHGLTKCAPRASHTPRTRGTGAHCAQNALLILGRLA